MMLHPCLRWVELLSAISFSAVCSVCGRRAEIMLLPGNAATYTSHLVAGGPVISSQPSPPGGMESDQSRSSW